MKAIIASFALLAIVALSCSKSDTQNPASSSTSNLQVKLTDNPATYQEVNVDVQEVRVKFSDDTTANGWVTLLTRAGVYNLLGLQGGIDTLLATATLPTGTVKQIRLILGSNNTIMDNSITYPLTIPSGAETGLKIPVNKPLNATLETIVIDFDAGLSIFQTGPGVYYLRPVLRIR